MAVALLGDPRVLVLDEPGNGLDPEGIAWLRTFLREFARQGRSVLVSSHLLAEMEQTADQLVVINRGPLRLPGRARPAAQLGRPAGAGALRRRRPGWPRRWPAPD